MFDPKKPDDVSHLRKVMDRSRRLLEPFRRYRVELLREYVGHRYSDEGAKREVMVNLLQMTAEAYSMALAANNPQVLVSTFYERLAPFASRFQMGVNNLLKEINLQETLAEIVLDAFFTVGIAKVTLMAGEEEVEAEGVWVDPGRPYVSAVSLDNWCHDMSARHWRQCRFMADKYRVSLEYARQNEMYDEEERAKLKACTKYPYDKDGDEKADTLTGGADTSDRDELEPMVDLWDVWLPRERLLVTLADSEDVGVLNVQEWSGPQYGPYHILSFNDVPDNTMPLSQANHLKPLHDLANRLMRKLSKQAGRQKEIMLYESGAEEDVARVNNTPDGGVARTDRADGFNVMRFNGADQNNHAFFLNTKSLFSEAAGNLQALLGLGPQSETLGQDRLIQENVNGKVAKMQQKTTRFAQRLCRDLGWIMWTHPTLEIPGQLEVEGTDFKLDRTWRPDQREGAFLDFNFDVEPYSMAYQSPGSRWNDIMQFVQGILLPAVPMLQEQGGAIDFKELTTIYAEYKNQPEIRRILRWDQKPPDAKPGPVGEQPSKPPITQRHVVRHNRSTKTPQGQDIAMAQQLLSSANNQSGQGGGYGS